MALTITSNRGAIKLGNSNSADNPLTINAGVTVSGGSYAVYANYSQSWTITNLGTLLGKYGVELNDANSAPGSALTNSGTGALIQGTSLGVLVLGSYSTVTNQGRIIGGSGDGVDLDAKSDAVSNSGTTALIQGSKNGNYAGPSAAVITNLGTIAGVSGDGVSLKGGGTVTNSTASARITGGTDGVYATTISAVVSNAGTIIGTSGAGVYLKAGGRVTNSSTAALISGGGNYGVRVNGGTGIVTNQGTMTGAVAGVDFLDGGTVANTGTASRILGGAWGGYFLGGAVIVTNQGTISGTLVNGLNIGDGGALTNSATGALINGADYGISAFGQLLTVVNQGSIVGTTDTGIDIAAGGMITNSGTAALISGGKFGIKAAGSAPTVSNQGHVVGTGNYGLLLGNGGVVTNSAGAVISGGLDGIYSQGGGALTLTNQGGITGGSGGFFGVNMQDGGTVLNTATGASIAGNDGGLFAANVAATILNQGSITGANVEGVYLGAGGTVTNTGTAARIAGATYGIKVNSGAATVIDQGTISGSTAVQFANVSGNVFELYPGAKVSGTVNGVSGTATLALGSGASAGIISGIGSQYTGFGALDVEAGADWTLSGSNAVVSGATLSVAAAATLTVSGKLVSLADLTLEGSGTIATSGTGAIEVGTAGTAAAGQFVIDAGQAMITDGAVSLRTVVNRGVVTGLGNEALYLGAGDSVTNSGTAAMISGSKYGVMAKGSAAAVANSGTIISRSFIGVYLGAGGSVTNSGTAALIAGGKYGIRATGSAAAVANFGSIISTADIGVYLGAGGSVTNTGTAAVISGQDYGIRAKGSAVAVTNFGSIISGSDIGVYLGDGGSVTNTGTAALISGNHGIRANGSAATVTNQGTITGAFIGVLLTGGGTVTNSGTIAGGVQFGGGFANRLVVDPGAKLSGVADGSNAVTSGVVSTLELASGTGADTFAGLGSHYVNFAQTTIDAGASWTLTGYNSLASGATLTNSGTLALANATLTDSGALINNGGITLDPSTLTVGTLLGTGVVTVGAGGMLNAQGTIAGGETLAFAGDNAELHLATPDSVSGTATNVGLGDLIDLQGVAPGSVSFADGTLSFSGGSIAVSLNGTPEVQAVASADGTVFEVVGPVITGTTSDQPVTDTTTVDPFSGVVVTDANAGQTETVAVTLSDIANGELSNLGSGNLNDGVYTDTGTAAQVTTALDGLVFTPTLDTGPLGHTVTTTFTIQATDTAGAIATDSTTSVVATAVPTLVTLATFNGTGNGANPLGGLLADSSGDLLGTTSKGGTDSDGTVFEITKSGGVFASTPATVVTFDGTGNGAFPKAGLIADATGDLLGTTAGGGAEAAGTVFEIASLGGGAYASTPDTLVAVSDSNTIGTDLDASLVADPAGDLFSTVPSPAGVNDGAVFEVVNGTTVLTQVVGFTGGDDGGEPKGALILDAAGDLFGTASDGGAESAGTVFEIVNTATGYATTATPLVTFTGGDDGGDPLGGLVTDANGDLFGTTSSGGAHGDGTVFEVENTATGYATTATTLATFNGTGNGANPADTLLIDSDGNLFGTTQNGGADGDGTVFEIANTATGYASTPITLATFNGTGNGANPYAGLIGDSAGDLFGTTQNGGADGDGTVFEVVSTGANFDPIIAGTAANQAVTDATYINPFSAVTIADPKSGQTQSVTVTLSNPANGTLENLDGGNFSDGVYTDTGTAAQVTTALDGLVFQPTGHQVPPGQTVTTTFTIADTDTFGATATDSTTSVVATAVAAPIAITGTAADQPATDRSMIDPFLNVLISDPNAGQTETVTLTQSDTANGTLSNLGGFSPTGTPGVYTDTNTAAQVTTDLQGLVFTPTFYPGVVGETATTSFTIADTDTAGQNATDSTTSVIATAVPVLTTLVTFNAAAENPRGGLIADRAGDLFGTTEKSVGDTSGFGTVFEIARTGVGTFATTPTTLVTFTYQGGVGANPYDGLIADAAGDLFGTTQYGGDADSDGTVFEVAKTATGYATTATTLIAFNGTGDGSNPYAGLIADAAGDLFGTTQYQGPGGGGTVFEIANTATGYATSPTTLVSFNDSNGANPKAGLIADAAGDLFGATTQGTVFEIANTATGYATSPTTLATIPGGSFLSQPIGTLIIDAAGNLIGTTIIGGPGGSGTVFEVENTATGYASTPITLASFNDSNGLAPNGLIADAAGDLFGITSGGGADSDGTVFEIANTATGYATTPITLASFDGTGNGAYPYGDLIADSAGDLFGTTSGGGATGDGTAFELTDTGLTFAPVISGTQAGQLVTDAATVRPSTNVTITDGNSGQTETVTVTLSNALNGTLTDLGNGNYAAGIYTDTGTAAQVTGDLDGLVFIPTAQQVPIGQTVTTTFTLNDVNTANAFATDSSTSVVATAAPPLTTLVTFDGTGNGADPVGGLLADGNGDLFGMTFQGGANKDGTVFELAKFGSTYATSPTTLATFAGASNGKSPAGGLIADAAGDLFGETQAGGASGDGTVFEVVNTATGYATAPITLATFTGIANGGSLFGGLISDTAGDLFGTASKGGANNDGTVFEVKNTATGYAAPTTLVTFDGTGNGATPKSGLLADAAGDLFGMTNAGGADGDGTVFEVANTATGYATTPTTLATFTGAATGAGPFGSLITDAAGDLFGVTQAGGADGDGTVFEIVNTATGYAATPTTLLTFDGAGNGATPGAALIADAAGDLFGTTETGGAGGDGTVFELAKTATGYAATPTTLVTFTGTANGTDPRANLIADAAGDLFGTTQNGGAHDDGTLFELTGTGLTFVPVITGTASGQTATDNTTINPFASVTITDGNAGQTETVTVTLSNAADGTLSNLANGNFAAGIYTDTGTAAEVTAALQGLVFTPTAAEVPPGQTVTTAFTIVDTDTATASATDSTTTVVTTDTGPRSLIWTGTANNSFSNAGNWDDTTFGHNPALWAENASDSVEFAGTGGAITGTDAAAAVSFDGGGAWQLVSGAVFSTPGTVTVGTSRVGALVIEQGSSLIETANAIIANTAGAGGSSVNVTGAGSEWQVGGALVVGNADTGVLAVTDGATVSAATLDVGDQASGAGVVTIAGNNADLITTGTVSVGDSGSGELSILDGANATIGGDLNIANAGTGTGNVDIEDTTGTITFGGNVVVGVNGFGVFNIGFGVDYIQNSGGIIFGPDSSGAINSFADPSPFFSNSAPTPIGLGGTGVDQLAAYLFNSGELTIPNNHALTFETPIIYGGGSFSLGSGDNMVLNVGTVSAQTFALGSNDRLTIGIDNLATIDVPPSGTSGFTPEANPNKGDLLLGSFGGVIANFTSGDTIAVDTHLASASAGTLSQNGAVVSVIEIANGATLGTLTFDNATNAAAAVADKAIVLEAVPCFAAGTRIATARGEVAVEAIGVGERVKVLLGDGFAEVIWVGRREVDCAGHAQPRKVWPVRVAAGAFGEGRPHADVWLSPDHAVFVNEVLIPVRHLVNGSTIAQVQVARVTYHHIELAEHDVVLAEGLPAESFLDMRDGSKYANRAGPVRLYPDYSARMWEAFGCARLVVTGPEFLVARALVAEFAADRVAA